MKLISCHIKNFGKLSNIDYDFKEGINSIIKKNGAGKSTLASFIFAMLYGMDSVKSNTVGFKDRAHYAPFNQNAFGGTLIFIHNNKEYRIERTFDRHSKASDTIKIYVDKEEVKFEKEIGEEILGLDEKSFMRLLFIDSKDIEMKSNGNIKKNLNNIIEDTVEGINFDDIKKRISELKSKYKKELKTLDNNKKELNETILNQESISNSLDKKYKARNELNNDLLICKEKQNEVNLIKERINLYNVYHSKLIDIEEKEHTLNKILNKYPNGIPLDEELKEIDNFLNEKISLESQIKAINFNEEEKVKLMTLKNKFTNDIPNDDEINILKSLSENKDNLKNKKLDNPFSNEDFNKLNYLKEKFKNGLPNEKDLDEIQKSITEYNNIDASSLNDIEKDISARFNNQNLEDDFNKINKLYLEYNDFKNSLDLNFKEENISINNKKRNKLPLIFMIISSLIFIVGIALCFILLPLGLTILGIGSIGFIIGLYIFLKKKRDLNFKYKNINRNDKNIKNEALLKTKEQEILNLLDKYKISGDTLNDKFDKYKTEYNRYINEIKNNIELNIKKKEKLNETIRSFLILYGESNDFNNDILELGYNIKSYNELSDKYEKYLNEVTNNNKEIDKLNEEIKNILSIYKLGLNDTYNFNDLNKDREDYIKLTNKFNNINELNIKLKTINDKIFELDEKYKLGLLDNNNLKNIYDDIKSITIYSDDIKTLKNKALEYKLTNKLDENENIDSLKISDFSKDIEVIESDLVKVDNEIEASEREIEGLEENKERLNDIKNKIKVIKHKEDILNKVEAEFIKSQKTLDDKYVSPIMNRFKYYSDLLGNILDIKIEMGRDFNILLNVNGELKSYEHLSSGQKSVCALCFRLALLDNIYNEELPFIIMDDPFLSLDNDNFLAMAKMIEKFSKNKQIIYFSCHDSRKILI